MTDFCQQCSASVRSQTILDLTSRGDLSVLLVEQHIGFALGAAQLLRDGVRTGDT